MDLGQGLFDSAEPCIYVRIQEARPVIPIDPDRRPVKVLSGYTEVLVQIIEEDDTMRITSVSLVDSVVHSGEGRATRLETVELAGVDALVITDLILKECL